MEWFVALFLVICVLIVATAIFGPKKPRENVYIDEFPKYHWLRPSLTGRCASSHQNDSDMLVSPANPASPLHDPTGGMGYGPIDD